MATTISIDEGVRDRLKGLLGPGLSYSQALTRLMDLVEADRFFKSFLDAMDDPDYPWIEEDEIKWD